VVILADLGIGYVQPEVQSFEGLVIGHSGNTGLVGRQAEVSQCAGRGARTVTGGITLHFEEGLVPAKGGFCVEVRDVDLLADGVRLVGVTGSKKQGNSEDAQKEQGQVKL